MSGRKIGEILLEAGVVDEKQLELALAEQAKTGGRLGELLAELGFTTEHAVSRALATQSGVEHLDLDQCDLDAEAVKLVPEALARRLSALPIRVEGDSLVVAMWTPTDIVAIDEIQRRTELFVRVVSASRRQLLRALDRAYGGDGAGAAQLEEIVARAVAETEKEGTDSSAGALVALVDELVAMAVRRDATDVHFQPDKKVLRVRFRIDGDLFQGPALDRALLAPVVARVKVMASLDISETRTPQDGKIRFPYENGVIDLRVSTFPSVWGESVVIRILDKDRQSFDLRSLGIRDRDREILERVAQRPNGLVLAVGPTGSGKSTTLYALLRTVNASRRKIITLEDPVEYEMPLVTQCQVNERAGLSFAAGLRSILRHDPDVVLVGEMRDQETAQLALRAALTGHLVFSTLHTNDSVRAISRLLDMNLDGFIIASCLALVSAQRLVRLVCSHCAETYDPEPEALAAVGLDESVRGSFAHGKGCERCNYTGSRGREALFEVLEVTPKLAALVSRAAPLDEIESVAKQEGLVTFREMAHRRALEGRISLEEAARVTSEF